MKKIQKKYVIIFLILIFFPILGTFCKKLYWLKDWGGYFGSIIAVLGSLFIFNLQKVNQKKLLDEKYIHDFSNKIIDDYYNNNDKSLYNYYAKISYYLYPTFDYLINFKPFSNYDAPQYKKISNYLVALERYREKLQNLKKGINDHPSFKRAKPDIYNCIIFTIDCDCEILNNLIRRMQEISNLKTKDYDTYLKSKKTINDSMILENNIKKFENFNREKSGELEKDLNKIVNYLKNAR